MYTPNLDGVYREHNSPGSVGGCGCGAVEDGVVLTSGTAAVEGERDRTIKKDMYCHHRAKTGHDMNV